jgi:aromatic ring-cleaving dioxygenase
MEYNMQKIREEVSEADLTQLLEMRQQRVAELMEVVQRGIYQIDYRGLAKQIIFWLILERHRLNVEEKPTEKRAGSEGGRGSPQ